MTDIADLEWGEVLPAHWKARRLKHVCEVFPSNVDKKSREDDPPVQLCNYTDVYYNDFITHDLPFMEATATLEQVERFGLRAGDTIVTKDSETPDDIAIAAYVPKDLPGVVCGYHLAIVRPRTSVSGSFIKWWFGSRSLKASVQVRANGLTRVGLGQYDLDNLVIPIPPLAEQVVISAFLDRETAKIDALVNEQRRLVELLKEKRKAIISHAVTKGLDPNAKMKPSGVEWLSDVPAHWAPVRVKTVVTALEQGWSPQCENYPAQAGEWGVLKVGCVNGGSFNPEENKLLPADLVPVPELGLRRGDVLVSRANTRELVGSAALVECDHPQLMICDKLYRLRSDPTSCLPEYLALFLGSPVARSVIEVEATGASSSMLNIPQSTILEMPLPLPPVEEQATIVAHLGERIALLDLLAREAAAATQLLIERRAALISAAVTGKVVISGHERDEVVA